MAHSLWLNCIIYTTVQKLRISKILFKEMNIKFLQKSASVH